MKELYNLLTQKEVTMGIAYEFFKEQPQQISSIEDQILFFIDHYNDFLTFYRVMMVQHKETKKKKENAHKELQAFRVEIEQQQKANKVFTEADKLHIKEKTEYLEALREEDDTIYYCGKPMEFNEVTTLLLKYQKLFKYLESADRAGRTKIASCLKSGSATLLWPLKTLLKSRIKHTGKGKKRNVLRELKIIVVSIPSNIERRVLGKMDININEHLPKQKEEEEKDEE